MSEHRILIVDDEAPARDRLRRLIDGLDDCRVCAEATNGQEALSMAEAHGPDVVFMDVRMPEMDGIEAAQALTAQATPPAVIFCTAYDDYALDAFEVQATDYLVKPVRREALAGALTRAARVNRVQSRQFVPEEPPAIVVRNQAGVERIELDRLYYAHADNKYVSLVHDRGETLCDYSLKELENSYSSHLLRIHRHTLVNRRYLEAMTRTQAGHQAQLSDPSGTRLRVSRRHAATVRDFLEG
ncbi:LytR/AlgR family response regulator transcription factor [Halomonadaceae bacterium KBTZ08]